MTLNFEASIRVYEAFPFELALGMLLSGASTREWSLARTKACCRYVVSRMQVSVSGVAR
ncbi:hypothetical protein BDR03DRAFT_938570, partial [Suillus americanus]